MQVGSPTCYFYLDSDRWSLWEKLIHSLSLPMIVQFMELDSAFSQCSLKNIVHHSVSQLNVPSVAKYMSQKSKRNSCK